jgi:hypothetical protein
MKTSPSDRVSVPRYRRVSTRMHNDERYRELSRPKPNGQSLWGYLLFGPRTVVIPGLLPVALETIAVDLRWPLPATRRVWEEIARHEMARADWLAPLIWLPNAPKHNPPQSPNVVRAWRRSFDDDLPPCDLKLQAEQFIQAFLKAFDEINRTKDEAFLKAFLEGSTKESATSLVNQKQKQYLKEVHPDAVGALWESPRGAQR